MLYVEYTDEGIVCPYCITTQFVAEIKNGAATNCGECGKPFRV